MLLGATARSIASHTSWARSGWSAPVNTAMICWQAGLSFRPLKKAGS